MVATSLSPHIAPKTRSEIQAMRKRPCKFYASEKTLIRHKGRAIVVFTQPIPGLNCFLSSEVLALAAEKAFKRGWRKIILTWGDSPSSVCFEGGYAYLLALNPSMASANDSSYRFDHFLCKINDMGGEYEEGGSADESNDCDWQPTW